MKLETEIVNRNQFSLKFQVRRDLRKRRQHFLYVFTIFFVTLSFSCFYYVLFCFQNQV